MEKLKIIFYNIAHIGDIYFSQPYVRNIINSNNEKFDYYIYCECNYFIFKDFPNLKKIKDYPNIFDMFISIDHRDILYYYDTQNNILMLNTWYGSFGNLNCINKPNNCDLYAYFDFYKLVIEKINMEHKLNIQFTQLNKILMLPKLPEINIDKFFEYKNSIDKSIVFYYNVLAMSGQGFPVNNHEEHLQIIKTLSNKDIVLFLPYKIDNIIDYINNNNITNIIFVDDMFNLIFDEDCENIYYYAKISLYCDTSFYFDTGRCFLYVNEEFNLINNKTTNKKYHFGANPHYYNIFNQYFDKPYSSFIGCNNYNYINQIINTI